MLSISITDLFPHSLVSPTFQSLTSFPPSLLSFSLSFSRYLFLSRLSTMVAGLSAPIGSQSSLTFLYFYFITLFAKIACTDFFARLWPTYFSLVVAKLVSGRIFITSLFPMPPEPAVRISVTSRMGSVNFANLIIRENNCFYHHGGLISNNEK